MNETESITSHSSKSRPWWQRIPLTLQIIIALVLAICLGIALGAGNPNAANKDLINNLAIPAELVLKALRALATPLILVAVLHTFMTTEIPGTAGRKLAVLLLTNTTVAILIGLLVANVLRPGTWGTLAPPEGTQAPSQSLDPWGLLKDVVPEAILKPLVDNNVIQLIVIALSFGIVLRAIKSEQTAQGKRGYQPIEDLVGTLFDAVIRILNWVIALIPLAVLGIVAKTVALQGFSPFKSLFAFIVAVLLALALQACYYLTRVKLGSWVNPLKFLAGGADAFLTAFSTSSSTVAMPITFEVLQTKIGLRESSASLGALVGANFNNDGTALYEAMSALFISQVIGQNLNLGQQLIVVITSIFASVGAAGIPNAGLVTMTLVFTSVGLPTQYIALLITVDWFLDRCRTAINVMGDMTVSALLDGKKPRSVDEV
ncbi:dicarboxylate/amino acid:cation symporter [Scytonema hofmannii FACHB-248]|uniref:Dicarboxylate/amino acid:cation symporter n=1 Tax=Scytonema hofmannii FACHB-248 TaxID=1842502 RepID=A0ABR8GRP1_9CYAN|nr:MULTISPECIES: dicarboxylate/amino acid:cation symporter [Nostocales]MBD2606071.1 dicarboxylate/amino acid:cation symporter [Scytonema hofmannii FACHB-248]